MDNAWRVILIDDDNPDGRTVSTREPQECSPSTRLSAVSEEQRIDLVRDTTGLEQRRASTGRLSGVEFLREIELCIATQSELDVLLSSILSRAVELLVGVSGCIYLYQPESIFSYSLFRLYEKDNQVFL